MSWIGLLFLIIVILAVIVYGPAAVLAWILGHIIWVVVIIILGVILSFILPFIFVSLLD